MKCKISLEPKLSNRAALIGAIVAFAVGAIATLAIRPPTKVIVEGSTDPISATTMESALNWRVPVSFQTNLEVLGDNIMYVADTISELSDGAFKLLIAEP